MVNMSKAVERWVVERGVAQLWLDLGTYEESVRAADPFIADVRCPLATEVTHLHLRDVAAHVGSLDASVEVG